MNPDIETAKKIVDFLNEVLKIDSAAVTALIDHRVPCNLGILDHPTVQVHMVDGKYAVGLLGLLNGLCGTKKDGWGVIEATYETQGEGDSKILGKLTGFVINESVRVNK